MLLNQVFEDYSTHSFFSVESPLTWKPLTWKFSCNKKLHENRLTLLFLFLDSKSSKNVSKAIWKPKYLCFITCVVQESISTQANSSQTSQWKILKSKLCSNNDVEHAPEGRQKGKICIFQIKLTFKAFPNTNRPSRVSGCWKIWHLDFHVKNK